MPFNPQLEYMNAFRDKTRRYFIEHFLSTFDAGVRKEVPFTLFPRQLEFLDSLTYKSNTIAIKHRQAGITTVTSAWITAQMVFASPQSPETVLCIGNKLDISQQLLEKIGNFLDQVPRWMWGDEFYSPDPNSKKNTTSIYTRRSDKRIELFNGCKVFARSSGPNAARGISAASIVVFDEAAFIQNGVSVYAQAVATTASVANAKIVMISTPNGKDALYYRTYTKALKKENNYNPVEFKWFQDPRYNRNLAWTRRTDDGKEEIIRETVLDKNGTITYNEERWRKLEQEKWIPTSPWYINMCQTFNNDSMKIAQELNVSFLGSADNAVPIEVIEAQLKQNVHLLPDDWPLRDKLIEDTWIWKLPIDGHRYICAVDNSSGSGEDLTSIEIFDVDAVGDDGIPFVEQVLEYNGKMTGDDVGSLVYDYAMTYNQALVVVEDIGGYGSATILSLLSRKYPNLYYDDPQIKNPTIMRKYSDYKIKDSEKLPGFHTSSVRFQMIANFIEMLKTNAFRVRSIRVITQLETWVFKNGRIDHQDGAHDDNLTCLAMGLFVMTFSMLKSERTKKRDEQILRSWLATSPRTKDESKPQNDTSMRVSPSKRYGMPFYSSKNDNEDRMRKLTMALFGTKPKR